MSSEFGPNLSQTLTQTQSESPLNCSTLKYASNTSAVGPREATANVANNIVTQSTQPHNKSPSKTNSSRFSTLVRIFKPWKWKRKKKSEKFEKTSKGDNHSIIFQIN